jgi:hypothetical protein
MSKPRPQTEAEKEVEENWRKRKVRENLFREAAYNYLERKVVVVNGSPRQLEGQPPNSGSASAAVEATTINPDIDDPDVAAVALAYTSLLSQEEFGKQQEQLQERSLHLTKQTYRLQIILIVLTIASSIQAAPIVYHFLQWLGV